MTVATEVTAERKLNIVAGVPIATAIPATTLADIKVYYGIDALLAVQNTDYTASLTPPFNTISITPTVSLLNKINALIVLNPEEINAITIRREKDYLTSATPDFAKSTKWVSGEFDATAMRFQQLSEAVNRGLSLAKTFVGLASITINQLIPGRALIVNDAGTGLVAGPDANAIQNAQANGAIAAAAATAAAGYANDADADRIAAANSASSAATSATNAGNAATAVITGATSDNTFDDTDEIIYKTGTTVKRGTLTGLISSIFTAARKITNAGFVAASLRFWNNAGTFNVTHNVEALTVNRVYTWPDADTVFGKLTGSAVYTLTAAQHDLSGIPAGVKRLTLLMDWTMPNAAPMIQLGTAGGIQTSTYVGSVANLYSGGGGYADWVTSILLQFQNYASIKKGAIVFTRVGTSNKWVVSSGSKSAAVCLDILSGTVVLPGELTQMRLTSTGGTAAHTGSAELIWEF